MWRKPFAHWRRVSPTSRACGEGGRNMPSRAAGGAGPDDAPPVKSRGRRRLTPGEVDKMVFNPQEGWEDEVGKIK